MNMWEKQLREGQFRTRKENPSFSSTLLDSIYRSIDESNGKVDEEELIFYRETMRKKNSSNNHCNAFMIEKWMQTKVTTSASAACEKVSVRRKSMADFDRKPRNNIESVLLNSSSSSSESSSGGGFSSSESDSFYGSKSRPKPIRTSVSTRPEKYDQRPRSVEIHHSYGSTQKPKHCSDQGGFLKTKSKALKIYSDLKKVKQPISPGGRLATFLNSLFTAGNPKKPKISSSSSSQRKPDQAESTCSSASSFSRSCLSKTPSSRGKLSNNGMKRSVRFYPVSVIVDEDCRPCGHKNLYENEQTTPRNYTNEELEFHVLKENRRIEEAARELLKNYQKKKIVGLRKLLGNC